MLPVRQDRATKVLTYIADVIVNGHPEIEGKDVKEIARRPASVSRCRCRWP